MKCFAVFRDYLGLCRVEIYTAAGIQNTGAFINFESETEVFQVPTEDFVEIYFE